MQKGLSCADGLLWNDSSVSKAASTMRDSNPGRFKQPTRFLRLQFLQDGGLPFTDMLSDKTVEHALTAVDVVWNDSIYTPLVTLWVFLSQVLNADHSCRGAVARYMSHLAGTTCVFVKDQC